MSAAKSDLDVLVLGHSHAYWLSAFIESSGLLDDLERQGHTCTVRFMGMFLPNRAPQEMAPFRF